MPRYLNLSELAHVRWLASEARRRRRPRKAARVRDYASALQSLKGTAPSNSSRRPLVPSPRRPMDTVPLDVLRDLVSALQRLAVAF
ncbi:MULTISPECIES: hypothetical protein [Nocardiopsis]|uniref:hypothetical protein n=1 Tax=Nocardiopsis TaxID=2013 RepID=UPI00036569C9|nr:MULTISPECIES: hypothetical protein [Nocardiopsis]PWV44273.1 hypothetical protein BDW27_12819 [Nocardiopsis sp. L17-MgMaSL7]